MSIGSIDNDANIANMAFTMTYKPKTKQPKKMEFTDITALAPNGENSLFKLQKGRKLR